MGQFNYLGKTLLYPGEIIRQTLKQSHKSTVSLLASSIINVWLPKNITSSLQEQVTIVIILQILYDLKKSIHLIFRNLGNEETLH